MVAIPVEHIRDSHQLIADARIDLYELTPSGGGGVIRFKNDQTVTWRGFEYTGIPLKLSGEKRNSDTGLTMPKLVVGDENVNLSLFKPFVHDGHLDNAIVVKQTVLLDNLINNRLIREFAIYRVKRVEGYSRTKITMQLATLSDSLGFNMPHRQFLPPAYPSVTME